MQKNELHTTLVCLENVSSQEPRYFINASSLISEPKKPAQSLKHSDDTQMPLPTWTWLENTIFPRQNCSTAQSMIALKTSALHEFFAFA